MNQHFKSTLFNLLVGGLTGLAFYSPVLAQTGDTKSPDDPKLKIYRSTPTKINDLVHTKLDVRFDYGKRHLYGKAWITLRPHFYATDSLTLDAKGMDIKAVAIVKGGKNAPLKYRYDSKELRIQLDKTYSSAESYVIYVDYVSKPDELKEAKGSAAITDSKGLYFINPDGKDPKKPIQIWTQGETEASSAWFPTIDKNNQRCTQEISMTVDKKYVTLSNGKMVSQKNNADGTRTDTWKMDLPHAPYLFMMAVGDFAVIKDQWRGKEVNYYVEKEYAPYAKNIFGNTPEMMTFFSKVLGVDYPWVKYSQVVVRDYVSGAMENTTGTIFGDFVQQTDRELLDDKFGEAVIAHELFHHWFGDLATCESWSNLSLNESFADYSEYLWFEQKYGKDMADEHGQEAVLSYWNFIQYAGDRDLIRFHYHDKEDMFDAVSYQKGGRILHMLRNYVGDDAFFKSLNLYLKTNSFKATEAHHLRLAFEEVTGRDLNWFFNQWYFGQGYPTLDISYVYDDAAKTVRVILQQEQKGDKIFQLPMAIDIYAGGKKERHQVTMYNKVDTFTFSYATKPDLVNVDADKVLLAKKNDHRDLATYVFQYTHAPQYLDRKEAIEVLLKQQTSDAGALKALQAALKDKYYGLRAMVLKGLNLKDAKVKEAVYSTVIDIAKNDPQSKARTAAITLLGKQKDASNAALFEHAVKDRSYAVAGAALNALSELDAEKGYALAKQLEKDSKGALSAAIGGVYAKKADPKDIAFFSRALEEASGQHKFEAAMLYLKVLANLEDTPAFQKGIDQIRGVAEQFNNKMVNNYLVMQLTPIAKNKADKGLTQQSDYVQQLIKDLKESGKEEE